MPKINTNAHLPYTPKQMYDLVNDVASYPNYLPLCRGVKVHSKTVTQQIATITLTHGKISFDFTIIAKMADSQHIDITLKDGPFKHLRGAWHFAPAHPTRCTVAFNLDFEFSNPLLNLTFGGLCKGMAQAMVAAFSKQAAHRYGKS
jgi:ribosome-associated toxin RatA of RatAB toxin-antitoxin module